MIKGLQIIIYIFSMLIPGILVSQQKEDFSDLMQKSISKLYENPDEAIQLTQNLLLSDKNKINQIQLQHLLAKAYALEGNYQQSVQISLDQPQLFNQNNKLDNVQQQYNLAWQYHTLNLYQQSQNLVKQLINQTYENPLFAAKIYQLKSSNEFNLNDLNNASKSLLQSNTFLTKPSIERNILQIENTILEAKIESKKNNKSLAKNKLEQTISKLKAENKYPYLLAESLLCLAEINFTEKNYVVSRDFSLQALEILKGKKFLPLYNTIQEKLADNYFALQEWEAYKQLQTDYLNQKSQIDDSQKNAIRYLLKQVENIENESVTKIKNSENRKTRYLSGICGLILVGLLFWFIREHLRKRELEKQLLFFEKMNAVKNENLQKNIPITSSQSAPKEKETKKNGLLSREKEEEILQKLTALENSDRFMNKNMSLATLAAQMDTNTKYLSEVINTYKGKNFNLYINELRINHIAYLLKHQPQYRNYKVSYLAEISGFSSHSAFATVFKGITGMTPNTYIRQINLNLVS